MPQLVSADDEYEPNDSRQQSTNIEGARDVWLSAIQSDDDWYQVASSYYEGSGGTALLLVKCRFTHTEGDVDIQVYDVDGNLLGSSSGTGDEERVDLLVPGTYLGVNLYYVRVHGANAGNTYSLWWDRRRPGIDIKPLRDNPTSISPERVVAGDSFTTHLSFENAGNINSPAFNIRIWANTTPSLTGAYLLDEARIETLSYIEAFTETGLGSTFPFPAEVPAGPSYFIIWQLDSDGEISGEAYVGNNIVIHPTQVEVIGTLAQALDTTDLTWSTGGEQPWSYFHFISHDTEDSAQSGPIVNAGESWIETEVVGPGVITFWWKVSSESSWDHLLYECVGEALQPDAVISGDPDWSFRRYLVPAGHQTLRWTYEKDGTDDWGFDAGWLDQVAWHSNTPPRQPTATSPADEAINVSPLPTFMATAFSDPDLNNGDTATKAQWQVDDQNDFSSVEWDSETDFFPSDPTNIITIPSQLYKLELNTLYYWRMRYADEHGVWSPWSPIVQFTTESSALAIDPLEREHDWYAATDQQIQVIANDSRTASSSTSWLRVTSGSFGSGDGTVKYRLDANVAMSARTGSIVITSAGIERTFTVMQRGHVHTELWGWGANEYGNLGNTTTLDSWSPLPMGEAVDKWRQVAAGGDHTAGIKTDGTLWTWGANYFGQLGDDNYPYDVLSPTRVGSESNWAMVAAGNAHTLSCRMDGTLWAWGLNENGQLGDGTLEDKHVPVRIGTETDWAAVCAGYAGSAGLKRDGSLWYWGFNGYSQAANGSTNDVSTPTMISAGKVWQDVAVGYGHVLAIDSERQLWAWGWNELGQLGDATGSNRMQPIQIGTANDWRAIFSGAGHSLGIRTDGKLWAWGYNENGQVGDGSTTSRFAPTLVGAETDWVVVSAGAEHSVAVASDGSLWAWGLNDEGQIGDGTIDPVHVPKQIGTDTDWLSLATGFEYSMATKTQGDPASLGDIPYSWLKANGLPVSGTANYVDLDGDGFTTLAEYRCGTDPRNQNSLLIITSIDSVQSGDFKGNRLRWQSVTNRSYEVERCTNLLEVSPFRRLNSGMLGWADETEFIDYQIGPGKLYLYRVRVE